jgi:hypothetical protein
MRRSRNAHLRAITVLLLAGCGGGGDGERFYVTINSDFVTDQAQTNLGGSTSLPQGSERLGGTALMPMVTCSLGTYSLTWHNQDNSATGDGFELWDCGADFAMWSALHVPLGFGVNRITVTFRDSSRTAEAVVAVTRK